MNSVTITIPKNIAHDLLTSDDPKVRDCAILNRALAIGLAGPREVDDAPPNPATVPAPRQRKPASAPRMAKAGRKPARIAGPVGGKMSAAESASRILSKMEPGTVYSAEVLRPLTGLGKAQFGRGMTHAINRESVTATGQKRATRYTRVG